MIYSDSFKESKLLINEDTNFTLAYILNLMIKNKNQEILF